MAACGEAAEAWSLFWAEQDHESRCLARSAEICGTLDGHWAEFARPLAPATRVIDLGCGGGAVGRALTSANSELRVTGIDIAQVPPTNEPHIETRSGVRMEELPFGNGAFGAAVSQFGFEYGAAETTATELARVLTPGAPISFLIHHPESSIIEGMRRHRRSIEGLCGLHVQAAFFSGNAGALADRFAVLRRECANDRLIEDAERGLHAHLGKDELQRLRVWRAVAEALAPELVMLDSLALLGPGDGAIEQIVESLRKWFDVKRLTVLRSLREEPLAWIVEGERT